MSITPTTGDAPAASPAPTTPAVTPSAPAAEEESISLGEARKLRQEHQSLRGRLAAFEKADADAKAAAMTETEKLKAEAEQERKARTLAEERTSRVEAERLIERAAVKAGIDPELATSLIRLDDLERGDDGKFSNPDKAVAALLKRWPHLAPASASVGSAANPARGVASTLTRADIKNMSSDEINRRWDEIQPLLASG